MMTKVETALVRAATSPPATRDRGALFVHPEGDDELGIANLRDTATIRVEFHSGSDRPVVGDAIRFGKRAVRRGLRWYLTPMWDQQTRFNHDLLDLIEKLRLSNEKLRNEVEQLRGQPDDDVGDDGR